MNQLLGVDREKLENFLCEQGEPAFRAAQIEQWLYRNVPFEEMSNLPKALRQKLREQADEGYLKLLDRRTSSDGTAKYLFELADGHTVETVFLPQEYGNSICISSQVGCAMGCAFCASGRNGLVRNLSCGEMLAQITAVQADVGEDNRIGNIVVMGMGEPLMNQAALVDFLKKASSPDGLGISQRSVTVSTCGLPARIDALAREGFQVTLAISLHAAIQEKRESLMPSARGNPIEDILAAARRYFDSTGRRITFEYALIENVNDGQEDLDALVHLLQGFPAHVNLIALNEWGGYHAPPKRRVHAFREALERRGISCTVRKSMGQDIEGACGQLRQRRMTSPN